MVTFHLFTPKNSLKMLCCRVATYSLQHYGSIVCVELWVLWVFEYIMLACVVRAYMRHRISYFYVPILQYVRLSCDEVEGHGLRSTWVGLSSFAACLVLCVSN